MSQSRAFELFKNCSSEFILKLESLTQPCRVPAGTLILSQGESNDRLILLSSGKVEVLVDGEQVAIMETPGDLIGEISVLTSRSITATIRALTDVEYLEVPAVQLESNIQNSKSDFGYQFYRALAFVVSEKVVRTNQKARRFEISNRALTDATQKLAEANRTLDQKVKDRTRDLQEKNLELESRNTELIASHRKLEELYSTKNTTFQKLDALQSHYLTPLRETISDLQKDSHSSAKARLERAQAQIESSIEMLRPFSELYSTEKAIRSRRVLLAEDDPKQQLITKLALGGTGVTLDVVASVDEAIEKLNSGSRYDLVFISSHLASLIPYVHKSLPQAKLVFMASTQVPSELPTLKQYAPSISNIVSRHSEDRTFTIKNVATTLSKLIAKDLFGPEKYLNWGVEVQARSICRSDQRESLIADMQSHFADLGVRKIIAERAGTVAEELLMNAIYDAPISSDGKSLYNHLARTELIQLKSHEQGEFRFACDGMLAAVAVSDPFGGFQLNTLLNYLERNYATNSVSVQESGKGGAGRGLHQIVENSDLIVFNVQRNIRTEVIAIFNLDSRNIAESAKPSFHFFLE